MHAKKESNTQKISSDHPIEPSVYQLPLSALNDGERINLDLIFRCCNRDHRLFEQVKAELLTYPGIDESGCLPDEYVVTIFRPQGIFCFGLVSGQLTTVPGKPDQMVAQVLVRKAVFPVVDDGVEMWELCDVLAGHVLASVSERAQELAKQAGDLSHLLVDVVVADQDILGRLLAQAFQKEKALVALQSPLGCPCDLSIRDSSKAN